MTSSHPPPKVPSVANAVAILRYISESPTPVGVNPLSRALGLSPSSCFNILKTLVGETFVDFDPVSKTYTLGGGAARLARRALDPTHAFETARADMTRLATAHAATCALWRILQDDRMMVIGHVEGRAHTGINMSVGQRLPLLVGAAGRSAAAAMGLEREALAQRFEAVVWEDPPTFEAYARDVEQAAKRGWAVDRGNYIRGVTSIAAPVTDEHGAARFILGLSMFGGDHPPKTLQAMGAETLATARAIARRVFGAH